MIVNKNKIKQFSDNGFADDLKALGKNGSISFNCEDVINLCEYMTLNNSCLEAFYFLKRAVDLFEWRGQAKNATASNVSKLLGFGVCIWKKVIFLQYPAYLLHNSESVTFNTDVSIYC